MIADTLKYFESRRAPIVRALAGLEPATEAQKILYGEAAHQFSVSVLRTA